MIRDWIEEFEDRGAADVGQPPGPFFKGELFVPSLAIWRVKFGRPFPKRGHGTKVRGSRQKSPLKKGDLGGCEEPLIKHPEYDQ